MKEFKKRVAVIDIGTLKTKFEIQEFDANNASKTIYKDKKLTVIGRDMQSNNGTIGTRGLTDTLNALKEYVDILEQYQVSLYRVVATEAIRKAKNADSVLRKIEAVVGVVPEILSHEEEASIYYQYVAKDFGDDEIAVVDVGGGSVQVTVGKGEQLKQSYLLQTGSYFLQESENPDYLPSEADLLAATEKITTAMQQIKNSDHTIKMLVYGSSNIRDVFTGLSIPMKPSGYNGQHDQKATIADMMKIYEQVVELSYKERMSLLPEEPYYMWSIDKAFLNIFEAARIFGINEVVPSNANISSGILYQLAVES